MAHERIKVTVDRDPPRQVGMFNGTAWLDAAARWAHSEGKTIEARRLDQRVKAGGEWFKVQWNEAAEDWTVTPEAI